MTTFEEVTQGLVTCFEAKDGALFAAGDILAALPKDQKLSAFAPELGCSTSFLSDLRTVARKFAPEDRAQTESWSLHLTAARTKDPVGYLELAIGNGWSVAQLREHLKEVGQIKSQAKKEKTCPHCGGEL